MCTGSKFFINFCFGNEREIFNNQFSMLNMQYKCPAFLLHITPVKVEAASVFLPLHKLNVRCT
jgi:hypothetical protein